MFPRKDLHKEIHKGGFPNVKLFVKASVSIKCPVGVNETNRMP